MSESPLPSPAAAHALFRARRTVKPPLFDGVDLPDATVERLLESACWAPTHGMNQPWRFQVYAGAGRRRLEDLLADLFLALNPGADPAGDKVAKVRENARQASHAVAVFVDRTQPGKIPFLEDVEAVACAVQNLQLAARAEGWGAFWSTNTVDYRDPVQVAFPGAPDTWRYLGVVFLGRPRGEFPASVRRPAAACTRWVRG
jgi:nitroreductase